MKTLRGVLNNPESNERYLFFRNLRRYNYEGVNKVHLLDIRSSPSTHIPPSGTQKGRCLLATKRLPLYPLVDKKLPQALLTLPLPTVGPLGLKMLATLAAIIVQVLSSPMLFLNMNKPICHSVLERG